jgi:hypothetical protein
MKVTEILVELKAVDRTLPLKCFITTDDIDSNIYVVGQVRPSFPGVILGDREPYFREKIVGDFTDELITFEDDFQDNDFLFELTVDLEDKFYEVRYFKLSSLLVSESEVILKSCSGEIIEFREKHEEPEYE